MGDQDLSVTGTSAKMEAYFVHRQEFGRDHSTFWIGHHTAGCYAWWKSLIIHFGTLCFTVTASHDCACHLSQILYTGQCLQIPICLRTERSVMPWLLASTCLYWNNKCFTWGGFRSSRWSGIDHQYTTLMSPNQGKTAVCGYSILCLMTGEAIAGCRK